MPNTRALQLLECPQLALALVVGPSLTHVYLQLGTTAVPGIKDTVVDL